MKEKAFYQFLLGFSSNPERMKHALEDKRLTKTEKLIIDGYLKIRNNQNIEVIELMKSSVPSPLKFVESQRLLLLGSASNNRSNLKEAESYLHASIEILNNLKAPYFSFFANFTLFWIYANLNQKEQMRLVLNVMEAIPLEGMHQEMRLLRCQFCYYQISENYEQAQLVMEEIEERKHELSESDIISFCVDKFSYLIQIEKFHEAYQVLSEMKKYRKFNLNENYNFMKKLLDHIVKDSPIYAYEEEFEKIPLLLNQIKLIQALEEKKIDEAKYYWKLLSASSPSTYGENFHYAGTKCLFSICLNKNIEKIVDRSSLKINSGPTKFDSLVSILIENKAPVPAPIIFEILWGVPPKDKEDLKKVSRLVSRAKKEKNLNIVFRKGTYELIVDPLKRTA